MENDKISLCLNFFVHECKCFAKFSKPALMHVAIFSRFIFGFSVDSRDIEQPYVQPTPPEPLETEEVSPVPFDPPIEEIDRNNKKKPKKKKSKKDKKHPKKEKSSSKHRSSTSSNRGVGEQRSPGNFQPFEGGSPVSPEDFVRSSGGGDHSPISSNENSRGSWNNGNGGNGRGPPWPRTPPESSLLPPLQQQQFLPVAAAVVQASGPRTPPMPMRGARTPEGPGPRTPEGKGARTPETPPEALESSRLSSSFQQKIRENVKGPSTPPGPDNVSMTAVLEQAYSSNRKGPRTPPDTFSPRGPVSPLDHQHSISPRSKRRTPPEDYETSHPPHKRRRSRERSPRDSRGNKRRSRDRYDDRRRNSRSPGRRNRGWCCLVN